MKTKITIPAIHPSLNDWANGTQWKRHKDKRFYQDLAYWSIKTDMQFKKVVVAHIIYYMDNKRRHDVDNYTPKFFMDALVKKGVILDDSSRFV